MKTFEDVRNAKEFVMGATSQSSSSYVNSALLKNVFGFKIKHVLGYPGSAEQRLAIERGELHGDCGAWGSIPANWLKSGKVVPFIRYSTATAEGMPPVPYILDKARNNEEKQVAKMVLVSSEIGRPFAVGPKVPADRLKILRTAFNAMVKDKEFLAEAVKSRREIIGPTTGEQDEATSKELCETPKRVIAKVATAVK